MKRSEYLDYVRTRYDRIARDGRIAGITSWGLLVGIVYLIWNTLPAYTSLRESKDALNLSLDLYGYMQLAIAFTYILISISVNSDTQNKFGIRVQKTPNNGLLALALLLYLGFGQPMLVFSIFEDRVNVTEFLWPQIQLTINHYFLLILVVMASVTAVWQRVYEIRTGYPSPIALYSESKYANISARLIWTLLSLEMVVGNLVSIYFLSTVRENESQIPSLVFSFNLALITISIILLFRTISSNVDLDKVLQIERDIVFHDLSESEIRTRVQDDIIGYEIGTWLQERIATERGNAERLIQQAERAEDFCAEYRKRDRALKHERSGRLDAYLTDLTKAQTDYIDESTKLQKWLRAVSGGGIHKYPERVSTVIDQTISEMKEISDNVREKVLIATSKLRELDKS